MWSDGISINEQLENKADKKVHKRWKKQKMSNSSFQSREGRVKNEEWERQKPSSKSQNTRHQQGRFLFCPFKRLFSSSRVRTPTHCGNYSWEELLLVSLLVRIHWYGGGGVGGMMGKGWVDKVEGRMCKKERSGRGTVSFPIQCWCHMNL